MVSSWTDNNLFRSNKQSQETNRDLPLERRMWDDKEYNFTNSRQGCNFINRLNQHFTNGAAWLVFLIACPIIK